MAVDGWAVTFGIVRRGLGGAAARPGLLLAVPNVTAHQLTASVPITYCSIMVRCSAVVMCPLKG